MEKIELCPHYTTSGYPNFRPMCRWRHKAGLWCHKEDAPHHCGRYACQLIADIGEVTV